eukprot:Stramenopile-MAST_4_protein_4520
MTYPVRGTSSFFRNDKDQFNQISREQIPIASIFAATKMPLYVLATTSCTPPIREVTTDTSLVQLVTPPDGPSDVICAFIYTREELLVQWSKPPVSRTERSSLDTTRKSVITNSGGVFERCSTEDSATYTSELKAINQKVNHKATARWVDVRVERKVLQKRLDLQKKAYSKPKSNLKELKAAIEGLENTYRLRKATDDLAGLSFNDKHVASVRKLLP